MATLARPPPPRRLPPSLPKDTTALKQCGHSSGAWGRPTPSSSIPDLSRLLARKPPPPPNRTPSSSASSARTFSNPPPLNLASKPAPLLDGSAVPQPSCLLCRDFSRVDAHAAFFPRTSVRSLEDLAYGLAEPFQDDVDKARAIFAWLHYNISYDAESFFSGNIQSSTPDSTLISGLAVCEGYAGLFENLGTLMGLQVHTVSGHGKGYGYEPLRDDEHVPEMTSNHAWNCIFFHGEWHLVDSCWGAGFLNGAVYQAKLASKWFIAPPDEFGQRHFPTDPLYPPPEGPKLTGDLDQFGLDPMHVEPSIKIIPDGQYARFSITKRCEHMSVADADNYVFVIGTTNQEYIPLEYVNHEGAWVANIFISGEGNVTLYSVDKVGDYDAKGLGVVGFKQAKGRKPMAFKGLAIWSVGHQ
ncbi:hypothetical protein CPB84DRAFT_1813763 [Gymnopilus junonius]|uniref:Transglutaminase-like domain-containing protein n=1 Tax=Gymnopilus junonius TaxID=109634 RepID=A0A9P5NW23_GYMJU|nr:hypothetical protein CPB84DRAFT_1813763 [Gymnopilus junonius]